MSILMVLALSSVMAYSSTVQVAANVIPNFNPSGLGSKFQQSVTVTVTASSTTVTSASGFTNWVGMTNFPIKLNDVDYAVSSVASASSLTLTSAYSGLTSSTARLTRGMVVAITNGSTTVTNYEQLFRPWIGLGGFTITIEGTNYTVASVDTAASLTLTTASAMTDAYAGGEWAPYVEVRVYSSVSFRPLGASYTVPQGSPGSSSWYKRFAASVISVSGVSYLYIPAFTLDSTTDAPGNNTARYTIAYYRPDTSEVDRYRCSCSTQLAVPPTTPTTLPDLCSYSCNAIIVPDNSSYTRGEIDRRIPTCTAGQMIYYALTGNAQACLTVGSGLTIAAGTISATGGAGSLPSATFTSANYTALVTDWLISVTTTSASRTVTLYAASGNTGKLVTVCKLTTDANTVAVSDGSSTLATIYAPETCVQLASTGSVWRLQSF